MSEAEPDIEPRRVNVAEVPEADSGDPLLALRVNGPSYHTAGEISGWDSRPHLDKDERNIVRRHRDKLE
jgi:hypothetical protein